MQHLNSDPSKTHPPIAQVDRRQSASNKDPNLNVVSGMGGGGYGNPLGRASVTGPIAPPGTPVEWDYMESFQYSRSGNPCALGTWAAHPVTVLCCRIKQLQQYLRMVVLIIIDVLLQAKARRQCWRALQWWASSTPAWVPPAPRSRCVVTKTTTNRCSCIIMHRCWRCDGPAMPCICSLSRLSLQDLLRHGFKTLLFPLLQRSSITRSSLEQPIKQ